MIRLTIEQSREARDEYTKYGLRFEDDASPEEVLTVVRQTLDLLWKPDSAPEEKFNRGQRVRFTESARKADFYGGRKAPSGVFYVHHYAHDASSPHEDLFLGTSPEGGSIGRWAQQHLEEAL